MKAAIDTPAAISLKATVDGMMDTVPTFMQEIRATVTAISATVKTLDEKIIQLHGHFTKTTLPSLSSRLDILEARATSVPATIVEEPPLSLLPESNAAPPPAALPVVLPSDPPDDTVILTPWVPDRVPDMFAAERVHHIAPPHISLQSHLASPGLTTGNSGNNAPMAEPPDTMANSRVAFAALQARMSHEAASETIGHTDGAKLSHAAANGATNHSPPAPSAHATSGRHVTPNHSTPSQPSNRYRQPTICESLFPGGVSIDSEGNGDLGHDGPDNYDFGHKGDHYNAARDVPIMGGPIISPRHSDRAMHAHTLGASRFDVMKLASAEYHYGMNGVDDLNESFIQDCGYGIVKATVEDVVVCFNDIIMVHRKVRDLWHNSYAHTLGPQVSTILTKHIKVFPKLESLVVEDVVTFYDRLQEVGSNYLIALMPFDAIVLSNRFEGLCPPGLGLLGYAAMS